MNNKPYFSPYLGLLFSEEIFQVSAFNPGIFVDFFRIRIYLGDVLAKEKDVVD